MKHFRWVFLLLLFSSCQFGRMVYYNFADIRDYRIFPTRELKATTPAFHFASVNDSTKLLGRVAYRGDTLDIDRFLKKSNTVAFLVIKNDTIRYENYFKGYEQSSVVASFSMAKSVTSLLIGCAISDGYIKSVQQPVTDFIPELREEFKQVTIEHLLQMTSGLKFNEGYINPFSHVCTFYYGRNLREHTEKLKLKYEPGTEFRYTSGNTQLLGLVLERALKNKTVTQYFQEKIWGPLGMEYDASWSIDQKKEGIEKTFCCINARTRDFAKIGRLCLNNGNWDNQQLVPSDWIGQSTKATTDNGGVWYYRYQWWIASKTGSDYFADGLLGQYIYVNPEKNVVIVRLGKNHGGVYWKRVFQGIANSL
ncbi:MAG: beta-lactamase-like protein with penicillin binding protein transpeptidase domain [Bacteroidetes bacterium]|nr:MAG: beta-lactamase-like protein with penicillin binding protein transpeptidase domain [Bacteroidota bacterium]